MNKKLESDKKFIKTVKKILPFLLPGLKSNQLYEKGILNLPIEYLKLISEDTMLLVYLSICIQAYPTNEWEHKDGEDVEAANVLKMLVGVAILQKNNLLTAKTTGGKLLDDNNILFEIIDPSARNLIEKLNNI
jgi:hypothetical protein